MDTEKEISLIKPTLSGQNITASLSVLLVDDNCVVLMANTLLLKTIHLNPFIAETTKEAVQLVCHQSIDVVITDLELPGGSGYELAKTLRILQSKHKPLIIIGLTGHSVSGVKRRCKQSGMDDVLQKPLNIDRLKKLIAM